MTKSPWSRFDRLLVLLVTFMVVALTVSTDG